MKTYDVHFGNMLLIAPQTFNTSLLQTCNRKTNFTMRKYKNRLNALYLMKRKYQPLADRFPFIEKMLQRIDAVINHTLTLTT